MDVDKPLFLDNPDWYESVDVMRDGFPEDGRGYHLTDKAPQDAIESYRQFYDDPDYLPPRMREGLIVD